MKQTQTDKEQKSNLGSSFSIKAETDGARTFSGYLAVFGNKDSYDDIIEKGAFANSLTEWISKGYFPPMLEQHGGWGMTSTDNTPVGVFTDMKEDDKGLYVEGKLYTTSRGNDLYTILKESPKGSIGMSIGYYCTRKEIVENDDGSRYRILKEIQLMEGSIVTFPANGEARIDDVKSGEKATEENVKTEVSGLTVRKLEKALREGHEMSHKQANAVVTTLKNLGVKIEDDSDSSEEKDNSPTIDDLLMNWVERENIQMAKDKKKKEVQEMLDRLQKAMDEV